MPREITPRITPKQGDALLQLIYWAEEMEAFDRPCREHQGGDLYKHRALIARVKRVLQRELKRN